VRLPKHRKAGASGAENFETYEGAKMPNEQDQPAPPKGLSASGRKLWRAVTREVAGQGVSLDSRELIWLEEAARLADRVAQLEAAIAGEDLIVPGHAKQPVAHPLLAESRQTRMLVAQMIARIRVDAPVEAAGAPAGVNQHRAAANARWRKGAV
jgi:hypothetical protein